MKRLPKNTLYLLLIAGLLLTGCELFSGTATPNDNPNTGYTWAREKALEAVADQYPDDGFYLTSFYSKRVDFFGQLDEAMQAPYWEFSFRSDVRDRLIISIFADGRVAVFEDEQSYGYLISGDYNDVQIRYWLTLAREVYRRFTGQEDDVSYMIGFHGSRSEEELSVWLHNSKGSIVAYVKINPDTGHITDFSPS